MLDEVKMLPKNQALLDAEVKKTPLHYKSPFHTFAISVSTLT